MSSKQICCLINAALSEMLLEGVRVFQEEFGVLFSFQVYYSHEIEEERVPTAKIREDLAGADLVMLDLRGSGRAVALAASALDGKSNAVVFP